MKKAVFVTGATIGTGLAVARKFASDGYGVFITSRDGEKAQAVAKTIGEEFGVIAKGYGLGIRDEEAVKAVFRDIDAQGCIVKAESEKVFLTSPAAWLRTPLPVYTL